MGKFKKITVTLIIIIISFAIIWILQAIMNPLMEKMTDYLKGLFHININIVLKDSKSVSKEDKWLKKKL